MGSVYGSTALTISPTTKADPINKDLPYYLAGLLLFLIPFASSEFVILFAAFTLIYYTSVISLLVLNRSKPELVPASLRFIREEEELVVEFNEIALDLSNIRGTSYRKVSDIFVIFPKVIKFSGHVLEFMPQFFERTFFTERGSP